VDWGAAAAHCTRNCEEYLYAQGSRIQITHAARPFSTTTARSDAEDAASHKTMATLMADVEAGNLPLDEQLEKMGLDPVEYKELWNSQKKAQKATAKREPKTREEAQKLWKQMQSTPDDLTLLRMYKRGGVEPIQLAKCVPTQSRMPTR
jgi:small subunit ribosomal protein S10